MGNKSALPHYCPTDVPDDVPVAAAMELAPDEVAATLRRWADGKARADLIDETERAEAHALVLAGAR